MPESDRYDEPLVDAIDAPAFVVSDGDVVYHNDAFASLVDGAIDGSLPVPVSTALGAYPSLEARVGEREQGVAAVETPAGERHYEVHRSAIDDGDGGGALYVLYDATERKRLERRNERLDQFASVISHDLRNPLDVAIGRTTAVAELADNPELDEHIAEIEAAHSRMRRIIEDVLTLAREGQNIDEPESVNLRRIAEDAWSHVDTTGARLDVRTDQIVVADATRLAQIFENLFRNSVEHGTTERMDELTIVVGDLDDGFFVADDGVGIPPEHRDQVFEAGYTARENGTGLGLAIVSTIAEAHGWETSVTASKEGGARFEFRGIDVRGSG